MTTPAWINLTPFSTPDLQMNRFSHRADFCVARVQGGVRLESRQPEVRDLGSVDIIQQDIGWLQVAVHNVGVQEGQSARDVAAPPKHQLQAVRSGSCRMEMRTDYGNFVLSPSDGITKSPDEASERLTHDAMDGLLSASL